MFSKERFWQEEKYLVIFFVICRIRVKENDILGIKAFLNLKGEDFENCLNKSKTFDSIRIFRNKINVKF